MKLHDNQHFSEWQKRNKKDDFKQKKPHGT